jgi:hypothetical protein
MLYETAGDAWKTNIGPSINSIPSDAFVAFQDAAGNLNVINQASKEMAGGLVSDNVEVPAGTKYFGLDVVIGISAEDLPHLARCENDLKVTFAGGAQANGSCQWNADRQIWQLGANDGSGWVDTGYKKPLVGGAQQAPAAAGIRWQGVELYRDPRERRRERLRAGPGEVREPAGECVGLGPGAASAAADGSEEGSVVSARAVREGARAMNLTDHFTDAELGVAGCDEQLVENARFLCTAILEPIRAKFGPVRVHDGYRDPGHNRRVGGKQTSYHLFEWGRAAADIDAVHASVMDLFDWIRLESKLPFDKVIMESNAQGVPATVHIQVDRLNRSAAPGLYGPHGRRPDILPQMVVD